MEAQVQVPWQRIGRRVDLVVVEDHRQSWVRAQSLAADARAQVHPTEVHGHGADRADAVHGQPDVPGRAKVLQHFQVVKHAGRCLAVDRPEPVCARGPVQRCFNPVPSHWEPPVDPQDLEPQQHPPRVVHKSVPKFAAADDQSATGEQRKLARYRVVGHRA